MTGFRTIYMYIYAGTYHIQMLVDGIPRERPRGIRRAR